MPVATLQWKGDLHGHLELIDQTLLPLTFKTVDCHTTGEVWDAIRRLVVRGAPAIGCAGAYGMVIGCREIQADQVEDFLDAMEHVADSLNAARPTAVNLSWATRRICDRLKAMPAGSVADLKEAVLHEAASIHQEDRDICRRIGRAGSALILENAGVLTHCNAGGLATADYGTALAVMFRAHEEGRTFRVFVDETRPLLQGARLTAWELRQADIPATLICDNMAAQVMKEGKVDLVVVGADRIAANGDTANKIGTYGLSIVAREHGVAFYVAAPRSTFDLTLEHGGLIPIEERDPVEITCGMGRQTAPDGMDVYNPAFDVTPARHITAFITEFGLIERPDRTNIHAFFQTHGAL